jgi:O-antigen ligase
MWVQGLLLLLLLLAPIIRGGNRPLALLCLEILGLLLLVGVLLKPAGLSRVSKWSLGFILALCLIPLVYLIPIPFSIWQHLPGHQSYAEAMRLLFDQDVMHLNLVPSMSSSLSWYSWLALIPSVAVFLAIAAGSREICWHVTLVFIFFAFFQALLGLAQYVQGQSSFLRFYWEFGGKAIGTFANRDHLAGFLEMALPLSIALALSALRRFETEVSMHDYRQSAVTLQANTLFYTFVAIFILLGLIFTQSRTGVFLGVVIVLVMMLIFMLRESRKSTYGLIGSVFLVAIAFAIAIGLVPVVDRFTADPMQDARWKIYRATWEAIQAFFPVGSGVGTFAEVFKPFHTADLSGMFINHAHNDYLEWLTEGGLWAAVLIVWFFIYYGIRWVKLIKLPRWQRYEYIQVAAGIGILAMSIHSLVDFNLHIPANQIYFALLLGLFFRLSKTGSSQKSRQAAALKI